MNLLGKARNWLNDGPGSESWALNYVTEYESLSISEQISLIPFMEKESKDFHAMQACPSCGWLAVHRFGKVVDRSVSIGSLSVSRKLIVRKCNRCGRRWKTK